MRCGKNEEFGAYLARLRRQAGKSQRRLAEILCDLSGCSTVTRHEIGRYERGERTPRYWLPYIAEALGVSLDELERRAHSAAGGQSAEIEFLPNDDFSLTRFRDATGRGIGHEAVADLFARIHRLRLADDVLAGGDLIRPAVRELDMAIKLHREASHTEEVGWSLLVAIGELAQIAGWIASDAGRDQRAEQIYRLGVSAAREAGDRTLAANLIGSLAYHKTNTGDPEAGSALATVALEEAGDDAPPRAKALFWDRVAWAYAKTEQSQMAVRALGEASEALANRRAEEEPAYLYWVDESELQIMEARVYVELRRPLRAVPALTQVLGRYDSTHTRELALYLSWLAVALADANEPEEAANTARRMFELSADMPSERTARRSHVVRACLRPFQGLPEVRDLFEAYGYPETVNLASRSR
ncbi:helix-turn-helix domain-containing protein [Actinoallomurus purpureus]|uniref:helix-turn-helix domain-containing protein n=1 Tax=Actinoallomurus purpureus TaxID=478114 RepID=UPI002091E667|nr:helix-turn-helix transcriptional regulator [Actinoallomurus purpureus]MCO6009040.1 helix-turn-helix domain-containing protein [Actinoallomurus purpureus]